ncbi:hypothetical protein ACFO5Q_03885 [Kordiimonas lipolytica]|uniref:Uncharacterized protein n=1 Tax=Kordiimonas lipolytica TaxID=1662421 RepID=A0ABV8U7W0_9PROT|nr:hypothetical protein [Kordiimonas lipolytica]
MSARLELTTALAALTIAGFSAIAFDTLFAKDGAFWAGWALGGLIAILTRDWFLSIYLEDRKENQD